MEPLILDDFLQPWQQEFALDENVLEGNLQSSASSTSFLKQVKLISENKYKEK